MNQFIKNLDLFAGKISKAFDQSSYAYQIGSMITIIFVNIYTPAYLAIMIFILIFEVLNCYFYDHLTDVKCLHIPYHYV